jgi:hypothetical protein
MAEGRHGIADMRRLAADAGGRLSVGRGPDECGGTVVRLDWPA